jgi:hypothetical protein
MSNQDRNDGVLQALRKIHRTGGIALHKLGADPVSVADPAPDFEDLMMTMRRLQSLPDVQPNEAEARLLATAILWIDSVLKRDGSQL